MVCKRAIIAFLLILAAIPSFCGINEWTSIGPWGGEITSLVVDPQDPQVLYISEQWTGVYKSEDGGENWLLSSNGLPEKSYWEDISLAVNYKNPSILYAGYNINEGLYKSSNGGVNWSKVQINTGEIDKVVTNPYNTSTVYVVSNTNIYKSNDDGLNWTVSSLGGGDINVNEIQVDPSSQICLYLGTSGGLFKWNEDSGNLTLLGLEGKTINTLTISPADPARIYLGVPEEGMYFSKNSGSTWTNVGKEILGSCVDTIFCDRKNEDIVHCVSNKGVFICEDGGETWVLVGQNDGWWCGSHSVFDPKNNSTIYVALGSCYGLKKSVDSGKTWKDIDRGIMAEGINVLEMSYRDPDKIYAGLTIWCGYFPGGGLGVSSDAGQTWQIQSIWGGAYALALDPRDENIIWKSTQACCVIGHVSKSIDGGLTWKVTSIPDEWIVTGIKYDQINPDIIYLLTEYPSTIKKSTDNGETWNQILENSYRLFIDAQNNSILYSSTYQDTTVYSVKSMDGGITWEKIGLEDGISSCSADPVNTGVVWGFSYYVSGCLYKSADYGVSWSPVYCPEEGSYCSGPWIDPTDTSKMYGFIQEICNGYYCTKLYKSTDGGLSWRLFNNGMPAGYGGIVINRFHPETLYLPTNHGIYTITQVPPKINSMTKLQDPFRLKVSGSNFQDGIKVYIGSDTEPWEKVIRKDDGTLIIKGGSKLKKKLPKGVPVQFKLVNPDGGETQFDFIR
jgi:photosystem II stability/assembly factor-like uncharacterized protein